MAAAVLHNKSLPDSAFEEVLGMVEKATDGLIQQLLR